LENSAPRASSFPAAFDLVFELGGRQIAEAHVRTLLIVVMPPLLDGDRRFDPIPKPLDRQALIAELSIEGLIRAVLPGLARIDEGRFDMGRLQPPEDRGRDEFRAVV